MNTNIINISRLPKLEGTPKDDQYIFSTDSEDESYKIQTKDIVFKDSTGKIKKEDLPKKEYTPKELYEAGQPFFFYLETLDGKRIYYNTNKFVPEEEKVETLENIKNIWQQVFFTDGINLYNPNNENIFDYGRTDSIAQNAIKFTSDDTIVLCGLYGVESGIEEDDVKETYWKFIEGTGFQIGVEKVEYRVKISPIPLYNRGSIILSVFPMEIEFDSNYFESDDASAFGLWDINTDSSITPQNDVYGSFNNIILRNTGIAFIDNIYLKQKFITLGRTITDKYSYESFTDKPTLDTIRSDGRRGNPQRLLSFAYLKNDSKSLNKEIVQKIVNVGTALSKKDSFYTCVSKNIPFGCRLYGEDSDVVLQTKATDNYLTYLESLGIPVIRNKEINSKDFVIVNSSIYSLDSNTYLACIIQGNTPIAVCWSHYINEKNLPQDMRIMPCQYIFQQIFNRNTSSFTTPQFNISYYKVKARVNAQGFLEKEGDSDKQFLTIDVKEEAIINSNPDYISIYPVGIWNNGIDGQIGYSVYSPIGLSSSLLDYRFNESPSLVDYQNNVSVFSNYQNIPAFKPLTVLVSNKIAEVDMGYGNKWRFNVVNRDQKYENNTPLFFFYPGQAQASHYKKLGRLKVVKDENYNYSLVKEIIPIEEAEPYIAYFEVTPELEKEILGGKPFTQREILDLLKEEKPAIFALKTLDGKYIDSTTGGVTEDTEVDDPDHPGQKIKVTKNSAFAIADRTFSSMTLRYNMQCPANSTDECQFKFINFSKDPTWYSPLVNVVFNEDNSISLQITNNYYLNWSEDQKWRMTTTKQNFIVEPTSIKYSTKDSKIFTLYSPLELHPNDNNVQVAHDIFIKGYTNTASMQINYYESIVRQDTPSFVNCGNVTSDTVEFTPVHTTLPPIKVNDIMGCYRQANITKLANAMIFTTKKTGGLMKFGDDFLVPFRAFIMQEPPVALVNVVTQAEYDALPEATKSSPKKIYLIYEDTTSAPGA